MLSREANVMTVSTFICLHDLTIKPVMIAKPMLANVPITRYSVFISCLSLSLNRMIPFAAIRRPIAEY